MTWAAISLPRSVDFGFARLDRGGDRRQVAADDHGDVAAAELLLADDLDVGRLAGRVDRLEHGGETLGFDEAQCERSSLGSWHGLFSAGSG